MKKVVETIEHVASEVVQETKHVAGSAVKTVNKVEEVFDRQVEYNNRAFERHPFLLGLLGTFGLVAVMYGFEGVIVQFQYFVDNPIVVLLFGLFLLTVTGVIYKRLTQG